MAVVVNMRNNKYKVHRILMPDGSIFKFNETKKDTEREMQRGVPKRSLANATSSVSNGSIPDSDKKVNRNHEISLENSSDRRFALPENSESAEATAEFTRELKTQLAEESEREYERDLARAKARDEKGSYHPSIVVAAERPESRLFIFVHFIYRSPRASVAPRKCLQNIHTFPKKQARL